MVLHTAAKYILYQQRNHSSVTSIIMPNSPSVTSGVCNYAAAVWLAKPSQTKGEICSLVMMYKMHQHNLVSIRKEEHILTPVIRSFCYKHPQGHVMWYQVIQDLCTTGKFYIPHQYLLSLQGCTMIITFYMRESGSGAPNGESACALYYEHDENWYFAYNVKELNDLPSTIIDTATSDPFLSLVVMPGASNQYTALTCNISNKALDFFF